MRKLGIMGGTFDPIHKGHIEIAHIAQSCVGMDQVLFLPAGCPPHKMQDGLASKIDRLNMTALAIEQLPPFAVSDLEINREGATYTVDSLEALHEQNPDSRLYLIIGGDTLAQMPTWREPERIATQCELVVVPRPGFALEPLRATLAQLREKIGLGGEIAVCGGPDIASTSIRMAIREQRFEASMLPEVVWQYIMDHGLYGAEYSEMSKMLRASMSESRFLHTLSVAQTAVRLAVTYHICPSGAHLAGMLHDCAKGMDAQALRRLIRSGGISVDELELGMPALLHAPAGVAVARTRYHVTDLDVLSAIRWHTTGRRNMTILEKIIYLADLIEPLRPEFHGLESVRAMAYQDLDRAVCMAAQNSVQYISKRGKRLHPRTLELSKG